MKKWKLILLIFACTIAALWIVGRLTNALQWYTIPTPSSEPALKRGAHIFSTNLITPKRLDFISFMVKPPGMDRKEVWLFRLCAMGGDTVEIRNGDLYVNGENVDAGLNLSHTYILHSGNARMNEVQVDYTYGEDSVSVTLSDHDFKNKQMKGRRWNVMKDEDNEEISKTYKAPWNEDHFGPVKIPPGKYFLMGDNRHRAMDSRYLGFIDEKDVIGTIIGH
jgi:signal peptidase I